MPNKLIKQSNELVKNFDLTKDRGLKGLLKLKSLMLLSNSRGSELEVTKTLKENCIKIGALDDGYRTAPLNLIKTMTPETAPKFKPIPEEERIQGSQAAGLSEDDQAELLEALPVLQLLRS